jgi:EAL and modified HD-GYP domain-containing signal transduction protein
MSDDENPRPRTQDATSAPAPTSVLALVARQSVYDASQTVIAYELLYRRSAAAVTAGVLDGTQATLQVITNAVLEIGLDRLAGGLPVHINYPQELLVSSPPLPVPAKRVVIEVLEDVRGEPPILQGIARMRARGHRIALDDYSPRISDPALLDVADIVKLDISQHTPQELADLVAVLRRRRLTLIAEHVETVEEFERCLALGFDAFQGYFLQHPRMFSARRVPSSRLGMLRLVAVLQSDDSAVNDIERLISLDISLSYRVLRCINSSYYGLTRQIASIRQAIVILGFQRLRELCALIALQGFDDRPPSLFVDAMTRARMCEQLGRLRGVQDTSVFFITGLFSMLDVLTGIPMPELLEELPLTAAVTRALLAQEGDLGVALREVQAYERGTWDPTTYGGLTPEVIHAAYIDAVSWAEAAQTLVAA